ncbi:MAG TPA: sulfotransferase [Bacteroidales bacterium]|nr:sulfotransferase [Bacteroidales bacterium]
MNERTMEDRPVFVIGADRSGTTLLRLLLTSHPLICIPPESLFFPLNESRFAGSLQMSGQLEEFITSLYQDGKFRDWKLDRDRLAERLHGLSDPDYATVVKNVYLLYVEMNAPGALIWGDKNPYNLFHVSVIKRHFPEARILHIIRDVRAVYHSLKDETIRKQWEISEPLTDFVRQRYQQVHKVHTGLLGDRNYFSLHYEELVRHPEKMMKEVCSFLRVDYDPSMLDFHRINRERELVPRHRLGWHAMTLKPVSGRRANAWRKGLTSEEIREIEHENALYLKDLGYAPAARRCVFSFAKWFKR